MDKPIINNEVVEVVDDAIEVVEEAVAVVTGKSKVLKVILFPFRVIGKGFKFGWKRFKVFNTKFRKFTNYATDDEKGPVIRFSLLLGMRIGLLFGIAGGIVLQHYVDVLQLVIDLFS